MQNRCFLMFFEIAWSNPHYKKSFVQNTNTKKRRKHPMKKGEKIKRNDYFHKVKS